MPNSIHFRQHTSNQRGVILIITLFLLMILSILTSISIKGATSNELIANQSRQRVLAQQAAEAALRFCENQVQAFRAGRVPNIQPQVFVAGVSPLWQSMANWDVEDATTVPALNIVPLTAFGDVAGGPNPVAYFNRPPECIAQYVAVGDVQRVNITARGFGPEVPTDRTDTAPVGTEVWLQSVITML
jgi:type IV pilus assembly protein PilX